MTLREQIEAASAKATQGVWEIAAWYHNSGTPDELCGGFIEADDSPTGVIDENWMQDSESLSRDLDLIVTLVNAWRAGKLLVIEDEQEAVRDMLTVALLSLNRDGHHADTLECLTHGDGRGTVPPRTLERAMIAALAALRGDKA